jgi:hypothetical protein
MQKNWKADISLAGMAKKKGAPVRMDELGELERMPLVWEGGMCTLDFFLS